MEWLFFRFIQKLNKLGKDNLFGLFAGLSVLMTANEWTFSKKLQNTWMKISIVNRRAFSELVKQVAFPYYSNGGQDDIFVLSVELYKHTSLEETNPCA